MPYLTCLCVLIAPQKAHLRSEPTTIAARVTCEFAKFLLLPKSHSMREPATVRVRSCRSFVRWPKLARIPLGRSRRESWSGRFGDRRIAILLWRICSCLTLSGALHRHERRQMSSIVMPLKHRQNGTECQARRSRARARRHSCVSLRGAVGRSSGSLRIVRDLHCRPPEIRLGRFTSPGKSLANGSPLFSMAWAW